MAYKDKARAYFSAVNNYDTATVEKMLDENYIQHNPNVPTGRAAFLAFLQKLKESGAKIENIRILEDGQHVIMHHKWKNAKAFGHDEMLAFHIIRFDSKGLIAEHWNVIAENDSPDTSPKIQYFKQHKVFRDGDFSLSISEGLHHGNRSAIYDLIRIEQDKIVAHWRISQKIPTENLANNNTMFGFEASAL